MIINRLRECGLLGGISSRTASRPSIGTVWREYQFQKCLISMASIYRPKIVDHRPISSSESTEKEENAEGFEPSSKSLKLLVNTGLIQHSSCSGAFHLLPIALKAMEKLISIVDEHMIGLSNCEKIKMPTLTSASLWKTTGRYEECRSELMCVSDRHSKEYVLGPTHEEAICDLIGSSPLSYRQLPKRLYQISEKFRDEIRPRFGLLRGRQFLMKDLYTFDVGIQEAQTTYNEVNEVYEKLLNTLQLNWIKARGTGGSIGGLVSDEFHIRSEIGEDYIISCDSCGLSFNAEFLEENKLRKGEAVAGAEVRRRRDALPAAATTSTPTNRCVNCLSKSLSTSKSIEVAHSFLLGTKYTKPLKVAYNNEVGQYICMEMGCYGLGVSRLFAAALEILSTEQELRWPIRIAPYMISVIPPKEGSREQLTAKPLSTKVYDLSKEIFPRDVIYDDRTHQTIGKRFQDNKRLGVPYIVVCGKSIMSASEPLFELYDVNKGTMELKDLNGIANFLKDVKTKLSS